MASPQEARVPDIGGYDDVPVIEVLVAVGDTVAKDQGLVTLESDKATMEVPSPFAGVVRELKVKVGDKLSEGSVVATIEGDGAGGADEAPPSKAQASGSATAAKPEAKPAESKPAESKPAESEPTESKPATAAAQSAAKGGGVQEARVPDIGDYTDVPVIEVLVEVGDTVAKDQGLVTLESDKATMEVPAPFAGVVKELKVKVGDTLSEGAVVALIEAATAHAAPPPRQAAEPPRADRPRTTRSRRRDRRRSVEPVAVSAAAPTSIARPRSTRARRHRSGSGRRARRRCASTPTRCCRTRCRTRAPRCACSRASSAST